MMITLGCSLCLVFLGSLLVLTFELTSEMISDQICDVGVGVLMYLDSFVYLLHLGIYPYIEWNLYLHKWLVFAIFAVIPLDPPTLTFLFSSVLCHHLSQLGEKGLMHTTL